MDIGQNNNSKGRKPHVYKGLKMNRLTYETKVASRCQSAIEFLQAVAVGLILATPFIIEIVKELLK